MSVSRSHSDFYFFGKSSQNNPKPVLILWSSIPGVLWLYTLLKVAGYYDLSVPSMQCWFSAGQKGISAARGGETGEKVFLP